MGLYEILFKRKTAAAEAKAYYKMLNGYTPVFSKAPESLYEMDITRAAIHTFAKYCSKLKPAVEGTAIRRLEKTLAYRPNPFMDTTKFLYRLATILMMNNTAFIVPIEDAGGGVIGVYPLMPIGCEVVEHNGVPYLRYTFGSGQRAAVELERVGILTRHQYTDELFGADNRALYPTMQMITMQTQGIINGVKTSAFIRFIGRIMGELKDKDLKAARDKFADMNLGEENKTGLMLYDNKFQDVKQVVSKPFTVDSQQMANINQNVFRYFGTNEKILTSNYTEDEWGAYYEGEIEPFAIQLSLVMTNMLLSKREIATGNGIIWTANRLQYASNNSKLQISIRLFDRGILTTNDVMDIWNLAHVPDGDKRWIRKEYAPTNEDTTKQNAGETEEDNHADQDAGTAVPPDTGNANDAKPK